MPIELRQIELRSLTQAAESLVDQKRWQEAAEAYARLAALCPRQPDIHHVHGLVLLEMKQGQAALVAIERAICLSPDNALFYRSRGNALMHTGNLQQAAEAYIKALSLMPADISTMINLGNALHAQGRPRDAVRWYRGALSIDPGHIMAINNIGKVFYDQGCIADALQWYEKALEIDPSYAQARFNRSVALLAQGDFARGWEQYEWRFRRKAAHRVYPHKIRGERWDGSPYSGKRLFVHCEQGMGDVIQFCRYLPRVKAMGGTLIVEAHAPLIPLLRLLDEIDEIIPFDAHRYPPVDFDLYAPLLSLPGLFQTRAGNIPGLAPYLFADTRKASLWRKRTGKGQGLRIGIVWSGSAADPNRACPVEHLSSLFEIPDTRFFSLQKGLAEQSLRRLPKGADVTYWGDLLNDFGDTAAAISVLDLVVSVDTAVAHLAGAMGKPVWILLPFAADWRWLLNRDDSPWYPTARLFRQKKAADWPALIPKVCTQLKHLAAVHTVFNRGCACHEKNQLDDAIEAYHETISLSPDIEPAHRNMGLAYFQKGNLQKAAECYERALKIKSASPDVLANLGAVYQRMQQHSLARPCFEKALVIDSSHVAARYNLGNLYLEQGDLKSAADQYNRVLTIAPRHVGSMCNLGRALHRLGRLEDALDLYARALSVAPEHAETRFNRAVTLLLQGKWTEGWPDYEWRFRCHNRHRIYPHRLSGDRWQGESYTGKTLLVYADQGLGDSLQFVRFLPLVKQRGGRVVLESHRSLLPLLRSLPGVDALVELSGLHPPKVNYDLHIPLCSLPGLFDITPDSMPCREPYLCAQQELVKHWRAGLPRTGIHVGLVWHGSNTYPERSCSLRELAGLSRIEGINWIGLQKGEFARQINDPQLPAGFKITNWGQDFKDFADTAAAVEALDLIISIDTSVAHLAGALGKPTWLLLPKVPDWRWQLNGPQTPWYPTMRLFRQRHSGDWQSVIVQVCAMLAKD